MNQKKEKASCLGEKWFYGYGIEQLIKLRKEVPLLCTIVGKTGALLMNMKHWSVCVMQMGYIAPSAGFEPTLPDIPTLVLCSTIILSIVACLYSSLHERSVQATTLILVELEAI